MGPGGVTPEGVTDNAPLPLLMTRPLKASKAFFAQLPPDIRTRFRPVYAPLIEPQPVPVHFRLGAYAGVIFTSSNGVAFAPQGEGKPAFCVGTATTEAAKHAGWNATECGANADALVERICDSRPPGPLLHLSGRHTRGDIAQRLTVQGIETHAVAIYDSVLQPLSAEAHTLLSGSECVIIPLFSPRTAAHLSAQAPTLTKHVPIAFSRAVAEALPQREREKTIVTSEPTAEAMRKALIDVIEAG